MKEKLLKKIEEIEIDYDYEQTYCNLYNACIDYMNETQDWSLEYIFEDYCDEEVLKQLVEYNLEKHGIWAVRNLLEDIKDECGIYRIDAYGYGYDIDKDDLELIKQEIIDEIKGGEDNE